MPTEIEWKAALSLLYEAEMEIQSLDRVAYGSYYFGNQLAERIEEFLRQVRLANE